MTTSNHFATDHLDADQRKIADAIVALLTEVFERAPDAGTQTFWTPQEWAARGEEHGRRSVLVLVHDGGDLAPFCSWDYQAYNLIDRLANVLEPLGYYVEQCTGWYSAVYPIAAITIPPGLAKKALPGLDDVQAAPATLGDPMYREVLDEVLATVRF